MDVRSVWALTKEDATVHCRLIYTTNAMEGFNRQLHKAAKAKSVFSSR